MRFSIREDAFDVRVEILPFIFAPEVVHHQEAAVQQIAAQAGDFFVRQIHLAGFDHVEERIVEDRLVGEFDNLSMRIDFQGRQFMQASESVLLEMRPSAAALRYALMPQSAADAE